ncbi:MAG: hypothetical protein C0443_11575 [Comamonadaceae bacterium]|nr:hypothetical protein [Comamonadaceae bacterium]
MFKRFRLLGAGLLALGLLAPVTHGLAQPGSAPSAQAAAPAGDWLRLLQSASIERVLREMPTYFKQGLDQAKAQGVPVPPEVESALKAAADEVFGFDGLQRAAMAHLQASLSAEQLADWLAFYSTPLGKKLTVADERAASSAFQSLLMERAPQVMETLSRDAGRMALLQSWLQATDAVEQGTNMALQSQLALEWGLISTMPQAVGKPSFEEVKNHMSSQRFAIRAQVSQMVLVHSAAAYQEFSQEELGQMLQRANSPAGKALYIDFSRQLYLTLVALTEKTGQAAGRRLAQQPA